LVFPQLPLDLLNEEMMVSFYDKQMLAYTCGSDKAAAGHVNRFTTFPAISYGDGEKVTNRCFVQPVNRNRDYSKLIPQLVGSLELDKRNVL